MVYVCRNTSLTRPTAAAAEYTTVNVSALKKLRTLELTLGSSYNVNMPDDRDINRAVEIVNQVSTSCRTYIIELPERFIYRVMRWDDTGLVAVEDGDTDNMAVTAFYDLLETLETISSDNLNMVSVRSSHTMHANRAGLLATVIRRRIPRLTSRGSFEVLYDSCKCCSFYS